MKLTVLELAFFILKGSLVIIRTVFILIGLMMIFAFLYLISPKRKFEKGECISYSETRINPHVTEISMSKIVNYNFIQYEIIDCLTGSLPNDMNHTCQWLKDKSRFVDIASVDKFFYSIQCDSIDQLKGDKSE